MNELSLLSAFIIGLAGSVHCFAMCGGIVSAFTFVIPKNAKHWPYIVAYNFGRILSYTLAGGITGALGMLFSHQVKQGIVVLEFISAIFLFVLALYIGNLWTGLKQLEKLGASLWRHISPLSKKLLPFPSPVHAVPYGMVWGWLPCGLVYSTLTWSMASGSAINGAAIMLCFGLGTLPALFAVAAGMQSVKLILSKPLTRHIMAICLLIFSITIVINAATQQ
jgi:sulfite exporter TauE/SafE